MAQGRCRSRGRTERAHRSLENRTEHSFPQRPHASSIGRRRKKSPYGNRLTHEIPDTPCIEVIAPHRRGRAPTQNGRILLRTKRPSVTDLRLRPRNGSQGPPADQRLHLPDAGTHHEVRLESRRVWSRNPARLSTSPVCFDRNSTQT